MIRTLRRFAYFFFFLPLRFVSASGRPCAWCPCYTETKRSVSFKPVVPVDATAAAAEWDGFLLIEKGRTNTNSCFRSIFNQGHSLQIRTSFWLCPSTHPDLIKCGSLPPVWQEQELIWSFLHYPTAFTATCAQRSDHIQPIADFLRASCVRKCSHVCVSISFPLFA